MLVHNRLDYIAISARRGQLSWSQTGLLPIPTEVRLHSCTRWTRAAWLTETNYGTQGNNLKSRHSILGACARTRPGLWCLPG